MRRSEQTTGDRLAMSGCIWLVVVTATGVVFWIVGVYAVGYLVRLAAKIG